MKSHWLKAAQPLWNLKAFLQGVFTGPHPSATKVLERALYFFEMIPQTRPAESKPNLAERFGMTDLLCHLLSRIFSIQNIHLYSWSVTVMLFLMTVKLWSKLNIPVGFYFPSFHPACCSLLPLDWLSRSMVWLAFPHCGAVGETLIFPVSWLSRVFIKGQREWWQLQEGRLLISGLITSGRSALNTIKYFNKCTVQQNNSSRAATKKK